MSKQGYNANRTPKHPFVPMPGLRTPAVQSILTTYKWNGLARAMHCGRPLLIDAGCDATGQSEGSVKLVAYYTPSQTSTPCRGAVILLHGWVGCSHSNYNLATTRAMVSAGYDVYALNLRDHGPGFHVHPQALNPGVFLGTLLSEAVAAIVACAELARPRPIYIVGFSMGGNFALRTALAQEGEPVPNLQKVIAVNPAINPLWSTRKLDGNLMLRRHFRGPWLAALREKQRLFPERYDFGPLEAIATLIDMTEWLVRYLGTHRDAEEYFAQYAVLGSATRDLRIPTLIITSQDDMVVPVADFYGLAPNPNLKIDIHPYGGHVGFVDGLPPSHKVGELIRLGIESD